MFGPHWDEAGSPYSLMEATPFMGVNPALYGLIPRAIERVFAAAEAQRRESGADYTVYCSFVQIYNEKLFDLFQDKESSRPLVIREDKLYGVFVEGVSEYVVTHAEDCFTLLRRGERNRITRQTRSNIKSSRSHTMF